MPTRGAAHGRSGTSSGHQRPGRSLPGVIVLRFADGTLTLAGLGEQHALIADLCVYDSRVGLHRAKALHYA